MESFQGTPSHSVAVWMVENGFVSSMNIHNTFNPNSPIHVIKFEKRVLQNPLAESEAIMLFFPRTVHSLFRHNHESFSVPTDFLAILFLLALTFYPSGVLSLTQRSVPTSTKSLGSTSNLCRFVQDTRILPPSLFSRFNWENVTVDNDERFHRSAKGKKENTHTNVCW